MESLLGAVAAVVLAWWMLSKMHASTTRDDTPSDVPPPAGKRTRFPWGPFVFILAAVALIVNGFIGRSRPPSAPPVPAQRVEPPKPQTAEDRAKEEAARVELAKIEAAKMKHLAKFDKMNQWDFCAREMAKYRSLKQRQVEGWSQAVETHASQFGVRAEDWSDIYAKEIRIGMSACAAMASWGRPEDINRTTSRHSVREQWVYGGGNYLYFEDGALTTVQN